MSNIDENAKDEFFTEEELRSITEEAGIDKIQKKAILALGDILTDIGTAITKLAIQNAKSEFPEEEIEPVEITRQLLMSAARRYATLEVPMIHYLWVISENGTNLFSKSYSGLNFPDTIFSGLLLGIANMVTEVTGRDLEKLVVGDLVIHIQEVPPILIAVISDDSKGIGTLVRQLGTEFLKIYGHRVNEPAVDINVFNSYEKTAREIIRDWGVALPSDATGDSVQKLLDPELIRQGVMVAAQQKDLKYAMNELRGMPMFQAVDEDDENAVENKIFASKREKVSNRKSGKELIDDIFSAIREIQTTPKVEESEIDEDDDLDDGLFIEDDE